MTQSLREKNPSAGGFNSMLMKSVDIALTAALGDSAAKAVKFYVDVSTITKEPDTFKKQLDKLFSASGAGSQLIEVKIMESMALLLKQSRSISVPTGNLETQDLKRFIEKCKRQFLLA